MNQPYAAAFANKLKAQPLRHRLRLADLGWRSFWYQRACRRSEQAHPMQDRGGMINVNPRLQPPPYRYGKLRGPWIESAFFQYWNRVGFSSPCRYLPIFFDPIFFHSQVQKYSSKQFDLLQACIRKTLDQLDPSQSFFTVLGMYDFPIWDWHLFPRNCVVYSAAGGGDIPIPLLSGDRPFRSAPKDIFLSFMGSLEGASNAGSVRQRMAEALQGFAHFGRGSDWEQVMGRSVFSLCPRGLGPTSFRLAEAMSLGSIPVYVWDQLEWLPYLDQLDWSQFSVSIHIDEIASLPALLQSISQQKIKDMQQKLAEIYPVYFSMASVCQYIHADSQLLNSVSRIHQITRNRGFE